MFDEFEGQIMSVHSTGFGMPQPKVLFESLRSLDIPGDVLELGSAWGRSSAALSFAVRSAGGRVIHSVDVAYRREWLENMTRLGLEDLFVSYPVYFQRFFRYAAKRQLRFAYIFIDGLHDFLSVTFDMYNATQLLLPGGVIACHDYGLHRFPGVTVAARLLLLRTDKFRVLSDRTAGSLFIVKAIAADQSRFSFREEMLSIRWFVSGLARSFVARDRL
jgi:hypothetical protein